MSGKTYNNTNPLSIYEHSRLLIGQSLHSYLGEIPDDHKRKGKGRLGQMVEELFFGYDVNSSSDADFKEAGLELKCTPLLPVKTSDSYRIKERLVCTMIDFFEIVKTDFEKSHLLAKCRLMLLLFYLHVNGVPAYDYRFIYRVLWSLPEKDLLLIKKDYETIAAKVRRGEAHLLSEGDTVYLGACRKGQKGDAQQSQPYSDIKANKRAFSLKPAYMRYVLDHVMQSGTDSYSNFQSGAEKIGFELVTESDLREKTFEEIIQDRFVPFIGKNYVEISSMLGIVPYQSKSKYADIAGLIASDKVSKRLSTSEEFVKSGIIMKTVRLRPDGMPRESMSFKNIDYHEVFQNDEWIDSEVYELFTSRFMFVVFRPEADRTIELLNNRTGQVVVEQGFVLDKVFFWTMPTDDLDTAQDYWTNIRENVMADNINLSAFWSIADHRKFHVRPKAAKASVKVDNPHGGYADKLCYWFNAEYVKQIIENSPR